MSKTPMPSPNGTNRAGLFLPSGSRAAVAYDAMPDDKPDQKSDDIATALALLREYLDEDDLSKVADMLGVKVDTAGMDRRRGFRGASDAARRVPPKPVEVNETTFPHMNRLKV